MNSSTTIANLSEALVKAQAKMGAAIKGASNPFFKSKYCDLNSVIEACKEHLNSEGISVLQPVVSDDTGDYVETVLVHKSGEWVSCRMKLKIAKDDMQSYGSAISYARRYGLQAMVFIPSSEDDDAEATMQRPKPAQATPPAAQKPAQTVPPAQQAAAAMTAQVAPAKPADTLAKKPYNPSFNNNKPAQAARPAGGFED